MACGKVTLSKLNLPAVLTILWGPQKDLHRVEQSRGVVPVSFQSFMRRDNT